MAPTKAKTRPAKAAAATTAGKPSTGLAGGQVTGLLVLADGTVIEGQGSARKASASAKCASTPP